MADYIKSVDYDVRHIQFIVNNKQRERKNKVFQTNRYRKPEKNRANSVQAAKLP